MLYRHSHLVICLLCLMKDAFVPAIQQPLDIPQNMPLLEEIRDQFPRASEIPAHQQMPICPWGLSC